MKLYQDNITDKGYKIHPGKNFVYEHLDVKEEHGSVFTAICFVSYRFPVLKKTNRSNANNKKIIKKNNTRRK
jgi:hypothetical protein